MRERVLTFRGFEALGSITLKLRFASDANAFWVLTQIIERQAKRLEDVFQPGVDVAVPEKVFETEPLCQFEDDKCVGATFPERRDCGLPQLYKTLGFIAAFKPYAQAFPFPRRANGQYNIGEGCCSR